MHDDLFHLLNHWSIDFHDRYANASIWDHHSSLQPEHNPGLLTHLNTSQHTDHHVVEVPDFASFHPIAERLAIDHQGHDHQIHPDGLHVHVAGCEPEHNGHILMPYVDPHPWTPDNFHGIGHPDIYYHDWQQQTGEDCAIVAQGDILASITGQVLSEHQLCQEAIAHHLYDPRMGTYPHDIGKLLELHGIPVERSENATFAELVWALQNNQRVMVRVNANEIWFPQRDIVTGEPAQLPYAGHVVWVTGVDPSPLGIKVILSDSGPPNGRAEAITIDDFLNAWYDANNFMLTTAYSYGPISV